MKTNRKPHFKFRVGDHVRYNGENLFVCNMGLTRNGEVCYNLDKDVASTDTKFKFIRQKDLLRVKTYAVDLHWDVAKCYHIEATSRKEAEKKMWNKVNAGEICVWKDGFEATDDVEVECHGEENIKTGQIEFD